MTLQCISQCVYSNWEIKDHYRDQKCGRNEFFSVCIEICMAKTSNNCRLRNGRSCKFLFSKNRASVHNKESRSEQISIRQHPCSCHFRKISVYHFERNMLVFISVINTSLQCIWCEIYTHQMALEHDLYFWGLKVNRATNCIIKPRQIISKVQMRKTQWWING